MLYLDQSHMIMLRLYSIHIYKCFYCNEMKLRQKLRKLKFKKLNETVDPVHILILSVYRDHGFVLVSLVPYLHIEFPS